MYQYNNLIINLNKNTNNNLSETKKYNLHADDCNLRFFLSSIFPGRYFWFLQDLLLTCHLFVILIPNGFPGHLMRARVRVCLLCAFYTRVAFGGGLRTIWWRTSTLLQSKCATIKLGLTLKLLFVYAKLPERRGFLNAAPVYFIEALALAPSLMPHQSFLSPLHACRRAFCISECGLRPMRAVHTADAITHSIAHCDSTSAQCQWLMRVSHKN